MSRTRREFLPFARPSIGEAEIEAVTDVLRSGWLTTGPQTARFEQDFASSVGAPAALALSSGTAALHLALVAAGIGPGDPVITSPMTFASTVHVIEHVGARPVLVDVDPLSLNLEPNLVDAHIRASSHAPAAIIPVHLAGQPVALEDFLSLARREGCVLIEDAAHAQGASHAGTPIGDVSTTDVVRAVAFSFYVTKNITTGEGGMLTGSPELLEAARAWSLHGLSRDAWNRYGEGGSWFYDITRAGFKYNMSDVQAALGIVQLARATEMRERRVAIARRYDEAFADLESVETPWRSSDGGHAWHLYAIRLHTDRTTLGRDEFIAAMADAKIGTSVHFIPIHHHSYYRTRYGYTDDSFPVASREFRRLVSLPIYPTMSDDDVEDVIDAVTRILSAASRA
jgi:dTDP-4-amino-4,6-dideoxygalactose transaminase